LRRTESCSRGRKRRGRSIQQATDPLGRSVLVGSDVLCNAGCRRHRPATAPAGRQALNNRMPQPYSGAAGPARILPPDRRAVVVPDSARREGHHRTAGLAGRYPQAALESVPANSGLYYDNLNARTEGPDPRHAKKARGGRRRDGSRFGGGELANFRVRIDAALGNTEANTPKNRPMAGKQTQKRAPRRVPQPDQRMHRLTEGCRQGKRE